VGTLYLLFVGTIYPIATRDMVTKSHGMLSSDADVADVDDGDEQSEKAVKLLNWIWVHFEF
jgi:hypothetical protein